MTAPAPAPTAVAATPGRDSLLRKIFSSPIAAVSFVVLAGLAVVTVLAPWIAPYDANVGNISNALQGSSAEHLLGTDSAGRDILSRILVGARVTLGGAALALAVAVLLGVTLGLVSGYYGRGFDLAAEWGNSLVMALPTIMVLLAVRASFGNNVWLSMTVLGILLAPGFYRLTRNIVMGVRNELYVDAARVAGLTDVRILGRHVLGAVRAPIIIHAALTGVTALGTQSGLEFIGLADTSVPAWGTMLNEALVNLYIAPGLMLWPGVALGLVNAALILFGNGLRDALEDRPRRRRRRGASRTVTAPPNAGEPAVPAAVVSTDAAAVAAAPAGTDAAEEPATAVPAAAPGAGTTPEGSVLTVRGLTIGYPTAEGTRVVVDDVTLGVRPGEVLGLVGESGSGKTQTAWALLDLLPREAQVLAGTMTFAGTELGARGRGERRRLLGTGIAYVPQEPMSNLDPSFTIGYQLVEPMRVQLGVSRAEAKERALALLERVGIADPERTFRSYPHQISGGMAQRVLIAGAVSCDPKVLIADEPTTALDVTVQAEVLELLRDLQQERGMAVVLVTHNFGVVADVCDRVAVMRLGKIVEEADVDTLFATPRHPYTRMLLDSVLEDKTPGKRLLADYSEVSR